MEIKLSISKTTKIPNPDQWDKKKEIDDIRSCEVSLDGSQEIVSEVFKKIEELAKSQGWKM